MNELYHIPVLKEACMEGLHIRPDGVYADLTFGGGGHSRAIMEHLGPQGRLYGFDQDEDAQRNVLTDKRFTFVHSNFRFVKQFMRYYRETGLDGALADLGVSSHHLDERERGFSFRFDEPLDMRMNRQSTTTTQSVLANYSEEQLSNVFYRYGELRNSRKLAAAIVGARSKQPILRTGQLMEIVKPYLPPAREKKELAKVFQALRIEVNHEMEALEQMLTAITDCLRPGGRLVVITYHSLEDRLVKNMMKWGNTEGTVHKDFHGNLLAPLKPVYNKVITPSDEEMATNPRSRSAKLRIAQKI